MCLWVKVNPDIRSTVYSLAINPRSWSRIAKIHPPSNEPWREAQVFRQLVQLIMAFGVVGKEIELFEDAEVGPLHVLGQQLPLDSALSYVVPLHSAAPENSLGTMSPLALVYSASFGAIGKKLAPRLTRTPAFCHRRIAVGTRITFGRHRP
jgi:hypothetical protein